MITITEQQLWDDFSYYQAQTGNYKKRRKDNPYIKAMKATPERLELMRQMKEWCESRHLPVRQWLFSLFAIRRWLYAPKLALGHICSENHLERFSTFKDYWLYTQRLQELAASTPVSSTGNFDPTRDISHTSEEAKRDYVRSGRTAICRFQMKIETFGYHPKSKICLECIEGNECAEQLKASVQFDIMALRRGDITAEQAYRQAIAQVGGYGS